MKDIYKKGVEGRIIKFSLYKRAAEGRTMSEVYIESVSILNEGCIEKEGERNP